MSRKLVIIVGLCAIVFLVHGNVLLAWLFTCDDIIYEQPACYGNVFCYGDYFEEDPVLSCLGWCVSNDGSRQIYYPLLCGDY